MGSTMPNTESERVAAIVVTYHPDQRFSQLIASVRPQVDAIWVVDNSAKIETTSRLHEYEQQSGGAISLILNPQNQGLATAQNQGITAALDAGYDWVLLVDQDGVPDEHMVSQMLCVARNCQVPERIGFLVPVHCDEGDGPAAKIYIRRNWGLLGRRSLRKPGEIEDRTAFAMASGCLIPAKRIREIGPMAEDFFIDYIDYDFSFRIRRAGYRIIVVEAAKLQHRLGERVEGQFFGRTKSYREHNATRRYTIYRNRLRVLFAHGFRFPEFLQFETLSISKDLLQLLIWEHDKQLKFYAILGGVAAGLRRQGGPRKT
jgi:GT2 family glycosyltransferase